MKEDEEELQKKKKKKEQRRLIKQAVWAAWKEEHQYDKNSDDNTSSSDSSSGNNSSSDESNSDNDAKRQETIKKENGAKQCQKNSDDEEPLIVHCSLNKSNGQDQSSKNQKVVVNNNTTQEKYNHTLYRQETAFFYNNPDLMPIWKSSTKAISSAEWRAAFFLIGEIPEQRISDKTKKIMRMTLDEAFQNISYEFNKQFPIFKKAFIDAVGEYKIDEDFDNEGFTIKQAMRELNIPQEKLAQQINDSVTKVTNYDLLNSNRQDATLARHILGNITDPTPLEVFSAVVRATKIINAHTAWIGGTSKAAEDDIQVLPEVLRQLWHKAYNHNCHQVPEKFKTELFHIIPSPEKVRNLSNTWHTEPISKATIANFNEKAMQSFVGQSVLLTMTKKITSAYSYTLQRAPLAKNLLHKKNCFSEQINPQAGSIQAGADPIFEVNNGDNSLCVKAWLTGHTTSVLTGRAFHLVASAGSLGNAVLHHTLPVIYKGKPHVTFDVMTTIRNGQFQKVRSNERHLDADLNNVTSLHAPNQHVTVNLLMQCLQKQLSTAKLERMLLPDVSIIHEIRSRNHCKRQECAQSEIHTKYPGKLYKCTCQCTTHIMPHQMPACIKIQESLKFAEHKSHPDFVQASFSIKNPMKLAINLNFCGSVQNEKVWPNPTNTSHQLPPQPILVPIMAAENYTTLRNFAIDATQLALVALATNYASHCYRNQDKWKICPLIQKMLQQSKITVRIFAACWGIMPTSLQVPRLYLCNPTMELPSQLSIAETVPYLLQFIKESAGLDPHKIDISESNITCPLCVETIQLKEYPEHYRLLHNMADFLIPTCDPTAVGMRAAQALATATIVKTLLWVRQHPQKSSDRVDIKNYEEKLVIEQEKNKRFCQTITELETNIKEKNEEMYQMKLQIAQLKKEAHERQMQAEAQRPKPKKEPVQDDYWHLQKRKKTYHLSN